MSQSNLVVRVVKLPPGQELFVWATWFLLSQALIIATIVFSRPFPWLDDFLFLPFVTDQTSLTAEWLWKPHNEHRIPLPKLFCWLTLKLDGGSFLLAKYLYALTFSLCA